MNHHHDRVAVGFERMAPQPYKVEQQISAEDRAELEQLARDEGVTATAIHQWLQAKGYDVSYRGTARWTADFRERLEQLRHAKEMASQFADLARASGGDLDDTMVARLQQLMTEKLMGVEAEGLDAGTLMKLSVALQNTIGWQQQRQQAEEKVRQMKQQTSGVVDQLKQLQKQVKQLSKNHQQGKQIDPAVFDQIEQELTGAQDQLNEAA